MLRKYAHQRKLRDGAALVPGGLLVVGGDPVLWRVWDLATRQPRVVVAPSKHAVN
jgi:hypothetical protein